MAKQSTTLTDKFVLKGRWWLPTDAARVVPGRLTFSPDGPTELELDGVLHDLEPGEWKGFRARVICGQTLDGKCCTLLDTFENQYQTHSGGQPSSKFFYNKLMIGNELIDPAQTMYESALVEFTHLGGWLHRDPFSHSNKGHDHTVDYSMPNTISVRVAALAASLRFEATMNSNQEYQKRTMRHTDILRIKPQRKQGLDCYLDVIFKLRVLLSLLAAEPVMPVSIRLCTKPKKIPALGKAPYRDYLDLCLRAVGKPKGKNLLPPEIPFRYPVIKKDLRKVLNAWFDNADRLRTAYGLHFGVQVNAGTPVEFQLLALVQALEAYHRDTGRDKYQSDKTYAPVQDRLIKAIPNSVTADHRAALKSRIKFGNEYSLRKRLTLTFRGIPKKLAAMITCGSTKQFINEVVATRNYLTHRDEGQKRDVLDFNGMFNASESLRLLMTFLLLKKAGLPVTLIESVMLSHWKYRNRNRIA